MSYIANIRDRRQITLPASILQKLSLSIGDKLVFQIKNKMLVAKPIKSQALDTLKAIQKSFSKTGISELELQESGKDLRKQLVKEIYGEEEED